MNELSDQELLRNFAERKSEPAFAELVRRHVDFVYSAALRIVCDSHTAEDVTQNTFIALAKNAPQVRDRSVLSSWLHSTARNLAANTIRSEIRRREREQEAAAMNQLLASQPEAVWKEIAPHLDDAIAELGDADRDALLLRYVERKSAREMGQIFGTSEEAAQKRVSRAVERLREFFSKRGIAIGASGLAVLISANAVHASPAGLAAAIITTTAVGGVVTGAAVSTPIALIAMKTTTVIIIGAATAATATYLFLHHKANRLEAQNQTLMAQQAQASPGQNAAPAPALDKSNQDASPQTDPNEVLRLRGQVGELRQQTNELARAQAATRSAQDRQLAEQMQQNAAKMSLAMQLLFNMSGNKLALTNLNQLKKAPPGALPGDVDLDKFEVVPQSAPLDYGWPDIAAFRERTPRQTSDGKWARVYGMVDGQAIEQISADGNFDAWEKQHLMPAQN